MLYRGRSHLYGGVSGLQRLGHLEHPVSGQRGDVLGQRRVEQVRVADHRAALARTLVVIRALARALVLAASPGAGAGAVTSAGVRERGRE